MHLPAATGSRPQAKKHESTSRAAIVLAAALCAVLIPYTTKHCVAGKLAEVEHAVACSPQWLPVLLSMAPAPSPPPSSAPPTASPPLRGLDFCSTCTQFMVEVSEKTDPQFPVGADPFIAYFDLGGQQQCVTVNGTCSFPNTQFEVPQTEFPCFNADRADCTVRPPPCVGADEVWCLPEKCKKYKPGKLEKCKKTCGLCEPLPPSPPGPPDDNCADLVDGKKCKIKKKKCNKNPPKTTNKCMKKCEKDRKKKQRCEKTCCELEHELPV